MHNENFDPNEKVNLFNEGEQIGQTIAVVAARKGQPAVFALAEFIGGTLHTLSSLVGAHRDPAIEAKRLRGAEPPANMQPNDFINPVAIVYAALMVARSVIQQNGDLVQFEMSPEIYSLAKHATELIAGTSPDPKLNSLMVKAIKDHEDKFGRSSFFPDASTPLVSRTLN